MLIHGLGATMGRKKWSPSVEITSLPSTMYVDAPETISGACSPAWSTITLTVNGQAWGAPTAAVDGVWSITATPTALMAGVGVAVNAVNGEGGVHSIPTTVSTALDLLGTSTLWIDTDPTSPWDAGDYILTVGPPESLTTITSDKGLTSSTITMATVARQPLTGSATIGGTLRRICQWLTSDRMASTFAVSSALGKAFHDGTGIDTYFSFRMPTPANGANQLLFGTNAIVANTFGSHCFVGPTGILQFRVSNGSGVLYANAAFGSVLTANVWYLIRVRFNANAIPVLRCTLVGSDGSFTQASSIATGVPSLDNAESPLQLGATSTNTQPAVMDIGFMAAFLGPELSISAADCLGDYIGTRWIGI